MTLVRILAVACVATFVVQVQAQNASGQSIPFPVSQPNVEIPSGTRFLAENAETIGIVWAIVAGVVGALVVGGILLRLWASSRQTNDPVKLAMADPWMRAKIEAMSEQERAAFFGQSR